MKKEIIVYSPAFMFYGLRACVIQLAAYFRLSGKKSLSFKLFCHNRRIWLAWCKAFWDNYTAAYKLQHYREKNNLPPFPFRKEKFKG
jgi:hypothetical protein